MATQPRFEHENVNLCLYEKSAKINMPVMHVSMHGKLMRQKASLYGLCAYYVVPNGDTGA